MSALRICYQTIEFGDVDIHLRTLRDRQEFSDPAGIAENLGISSASWPHFGVIWESSRVLANVMFEHDIENKRILEIGCGIGLASLILNHRLADITATDHHPEAENFLQQNVALNAGKAIPFECVNWTANKTSLGLFDLIIGSDILYEYEHPKDVSRFVDLHAARHCDVVIVDPGRGNHARFSKCMIALGYSHRQNKPDWPDKRAPPFSGQVLRYAR